MPLSKYIRNIFDVVLKSVGFCHAEWHMDSEVIVNCITGVLCIGVLVVIDLSLSRGCCNC